MMAARRGPLQGLIRRAGNRSACFKCYISVSRLCLHSCRPICVSYIIRPVVSVIYVSDGTFLSAYWFIID